MLNVRKVLSFSALMTVIASLAPSQSFAQEKTLLGSFSTTYEERKISECSYEVTYQSKSDQEMSEECTDIATRAGYSQSQYVITCEPYNPGAYTTPNIVPCSALPFVHRGVWKFYVYATPR